MIDRLVGLYTGYKYSGGNEDYVPEMAIEQIQLINKAAPLLTVLFPPWRGGEYFYDILTRRLTHNGSAVLRYKFNPQILEPDSKRVLASFAHIQKTVAADIRQLTKDNRYDGIHLLASSLGNVSLALVAAAFPDFSRATLILAGSNLARCTWEGSRTQSLREGFEAQGFDEEALDKAWSPIAPMRSATAFRGKSVHMITSSTDTIIPSQYQDEMVSEMEAAGANTALTTYRTGHIATVIRYCMNGSI